VSGPSNGRRAAELGGTNPFLREKVGTAHSSGRPLLANSYAAGKIKRVAKLGAADFPKPKQCADGQSTDVGRSSAHCPNSETLETDVSVWLRSDSKYADCQYGGVYAWRSKSKHDKENAL
jgi:hypothetical protein